MWDNSSIGRAIAFDYEKPKALSNRHKQWVVGSIPTYPTTCSVILTRSYLVEDCNPSDYWLNSNTLLHNKNPHKRYWNFKPQH
jgi:hypothetical protein